MTAKHSLNISIVNCGGMIDQMSEGEAQFLSASFGLFRNVHDLGRATPRAVGTLFRAYKPADAIRAFKATDIDILHLIAQGAADRSGGVAIQVGVRPLSAATLERVSTSAIGLKLPEVVVSTVCCFDDRQWHSVLGKLGVKMVISSDAKISPANLAAFDMAFYSALLSQVRKNRTILQRVEESFGLANDYYGSIHADGSPRAKFTLTKLT